MPSLEETTVWQEALSVPSTLRATLSSAVGYDEVAARIAATRGRVVVVGNGAAYYVGLGLWLASLQSATGPAVHAVPAGAACSPGFQWGADDLLLAVSSSGQLRDVVELLERLPTLAGVAITGDPISPIARSAHATAVVEVQSQRALTHTQAFAANMAAALAIWSRVTGDGVLAAAVGQSADACEGSLALAVPWAREVAQRMPQLRAAVAFGSGPAWAAAMEAALLLKEIALLPAEGMETREGATSGMYALSAHDLVLSLPTGADRLLEEAEATCRRTGALVERVPGGDLADPRLAALTTFAPVLALSVTLGLQAGLDVDRPAWADAYYATARTS